jgi:hypothetical protein
MRFDGRDPCSPGVMQPASFVIDVPEDLNRLPEHVAPRLTINGCGGAVSATGLRLLALLCTAAADAADGRGP